MFLASHQNRAGPRVADWGTACPTCYRVVSPHHTALTKKGRQAEGHPSAPFSPRPGRRSNYGPLLGTHTWPKGPLRPTDNHPPLPFARRPQDNLRPPERTPGRRTPCGPISGENARPKDTLRLTRLVAMKYHMAL